ncbi:AbiV family abortive infection protein [Bradyrhizobium centrosematis]|uniref:AbiV family abortive infection protein n=1 Tax=Bradyrhizobium centrosematis TaxID=1300039 RepID=UPI0021687B6D|nr:AbiV family abortive infection protein [Bradyrhizobium centrosematis]MCS3759336.1 AbiV family abortive infection protein [Bradyrhizobium centrosematis]MCS3772774.1 AbiV family abortive infection protein [Bradyrhizobium centrosematis]
MKDLSLETICEGMIAIRTNVSELLDEAKLLHHNTRFSRAYALAYMACGEAGKLPILWGTATRLALGLPVDWKATAKRFRSHESKARQFFGLASAAPIILEAVASGQKTVDRMQVMGEAALGVVLGPTLFGSRNSSIYCDFVEGVFVTPGSQIDELMADKMIQYAEHNLIAANSVTSGSIDDLASRIRSRASQESYDSNEAEAARLVDAIHKAAESAESDDR